MLKLALIITALLVLAGTASAHPGHTDLGHGFGGQPSDGLVAIVVGSVLLASVLLTSALALRSRRLAASRSDRRPPRP